MFSPPSLFFLFVQKFVGLSTIFDRVNQLTVNTCISLSHPLSRQSLPFRRRSLLLERPRSGSPSSSSPLAPTSSGGLFLFFAILYATSYVIVIFGCPAAFVHCHGGWHGSAYLVRRRQPHHASSASDAATSASHGQGQEFPRGSRSGFVSGIFFFLGPRRRPSGA